jgi:hypothetical protein
MRRADSLITARFERVLHRSTVVVGNFVVDEGDFVDARLKIHR